MSGWSCTLRVFFMMYRCLEKGQTGPSARERFRRMDPLSSVVRADCGCRTCSLGGVWKNEGGCRADCRQVLNVLRSDLYWQADSVWSVFWKAHVGQSLTRITVNSLFQSASQAGILQMYCRVSCRAERWGEAAVGECPCRPLPITDTWLNKWHKEVL